MQHKIVIFIALVSMLDLISCSHYTPGSHKPPGLKKKGHGSMGFPRLLNDYSYKRGRGSPKGVPVRRKVGPSHMKGRRKSSSDSCSDEKGRGAPKRVPVKRKVGQSNMKGGRSDYAKKRGGKNKNKNRFRTKYRFKKGSSSSSSSDSDFRKYRKRHRVGTSQY